MAAHTVDLTVISRVYNDAARRMKTYRAEERARLGAAKTSLADLARYAVLGYEGQQLTEDLGVPIVGRAPHKAFRFAMGAEEYAAASERIQGYGTSVTRVVHEALARFARTGKMPPAVTP